MLIGCVALEGAGAEGSYLEIDTEGYRPNVV